MEKKTIEALGMSEEQAVYEIEFMRAFDKFLLEELGADNYGQLCLKFSRIKAEEELRAAGNPEELIRAIIDGARPSNETPLN